MGSEGGGVFKSSDGGDHWLAVSSGLDELTVEGLAMDPSDPAVLYACGPNGVYKTLTGASCRPELFNQRQSTSFLNMPAATQRQNRIAAVNASIGYATAVTTDAIGNVYFTISDPSNKRVRGVFSDGTITTVAGNNGGGYSMKRAPPKPCRSPPT